MASIEILNGYLYLKFRNKIKKYSDRTSLHIKATQQSLRQARQDLKRGKIKVPNADPLRDLRDIPTKLTLTEVAQSYYVHKNLGPRTRTIYAQAIKHLEAAAGSKFIYEYKKEDYIKLINYLNSLQTFVTRVNKKTKEKKKELVRTGAAQNSQSMYTRTLAALFNYMVKEHLVTENIIGRIPAHNKVPRPIAPEDMKAILDKLKETSIDQYNIIYFIYNTGIRISTALALRWEDIDWPQNRIIFRNVKVQGKEYTFPIIEPLKKILQSMGPKAKGKIFPYESNNSMHFFRRVQDKLKLDNRYGLHKLKSTFISDMVNEGMSLEELSEITNTELRTLKKHYMKIDQKRIADKLEKIKRL